MLVLSINVASAGDNTTKEVISLSEENTLGDPATIGTFDELQKYIDKSTTGQISLNRSYDYDSTDSAYITGINITKAIEIEGNGYTIDGNHTARIFNVTAGDVVLKNINFVNANATLNSGGAIYNSANNLKIINCTFNSNHAKDGGAIYTLGNITIEDSTFKSNDAYNETKGSNHHAGAIYIKGKQSSIKNSIFDSNYANVHGAIYFEGINLTLNNCSFKLNRAGGSGALGTKGKYLQVNNCTFESNNGTTGFGGAINSEGTKLNISNSTFRENSIGSLSGGALFFDESDVVIFNSTFELNDGGHGGGAIFAQNYNNIKIIGSRFKSNCGAWFGGAINLNYEQQQEPFEGILNISDSIFESNYMDLDLGVNGGAIAAGGTNAHLFIYNTTFKSNQAKSLGGAIDSTIPTNISNCRFENNTANWGGAISYDYNDINIYASNFTSNQAITMDLQGFTSVGNGGAIYVVGTSATISNCTFKSNNATSSGGAIYVDDISAAISNCTFKSNNATSRGGAIFSRGNNAVIFNTTYELNSAGEEGGAIYSVGNNAVIFNTTYELNSAVAKGGAIYSEGKNATIDLAYFNANNATQGSAIVTLGIINVNENITGLELATGVYTVNLITIVDANHTTAINRMSTITVKKADSSVSVDSVKAVYGEEIVIPISCENATDIDYIIINGDGIVVAEGTVEPGKDINVYELPVGDYS